MNENEATVDLSQDTLDFVDQLLEKFIELNRKNSDSK